MRPSIDEMETDEIFLPSRVTAADVESKVQLAVSRVTRGCRINRNGTVLRYVLIRMLVFVGVQVRCLAKTNFPSGIFWSHQFHWITIARLARLVHSLAAGLG